VPTLWRWSARQDRWDWTAELPDDKEKAASVLRGHKRRNPRGTVFRVTPTGDPPKKKFFRKAAKVKETAE